MSDLTEQLREAIIELAGNRALFDSSERWLSRAAHKGGISVRTAKSLFYREKSDVRASVAASVFAALDQQRASPEHAEHRQDQISIQQLRDRIARLEEALSLSESPPLDSAPTFDGRVIFHKRG